MRRAARVDDNQAAIVAALRQAGASVAITSGVGGGFPDLVVGYRGANYLMEVKDGRKPASRWRLTEAEQRFFDDWLGEANVVKSVREALAVLGANE